MTKKHSKAQENPHRAELIKSLICDISGARTEMDIAQKNFDRVYNCDEVDYYIYKLRAAQTRYDYLIKRLKEINTF